MTPMDRLALVYQSGTARFILDFRHRSTASGRDWIDLGPIRAVERVT